MKTEQMPAITIATVTYNAVGTLARTLQSVAAQDYPNIEHLIVDGRSTDGTLSLVQRYVEENVHRDVPHVIRLASVRHAPFVLVLGTEAIDSPVVDAGATDVERFGLYGIVPDSSDLRRVLLREHI